MPDKCDVRNDVNTSTGHPSKKQKNSKVERSELSVGNKENIPSTPTDENTSVRTDFRKLAFPLIQTKTHSKFYSFIDRGPEPTSGGPVLFKYHQ